ncbi:MAG: hypothetical protein A2051_01160 [Desulfovibrionales bacterium GWA2_65_9]|nr:MAG: hypothetical protein A2051_01160 [Desulfovibrionales bacterium GWA2_65_9]
MPWMSRILFLAVAMVLGGVLADPAFCEDPCKDAVQRRAFEEAISICSDQIKSQESNADIHATAYQHRGQAYAGKREYKLAIQDLTRAIALRPDFPEALNGRGMVYEAENELKRASEDYEQALRLMPGYVRAQHNLENVRAKLEKPGTGIGAKKYEVHISRPNPAVTVGFGYGELISPGESLKRYNR